MTTSPIGSNEIIQQKQECARAKTETDSLLARIDECASDLLMIEGTRHKYDDVKNVPEGALRDVLNKYHAEDFDGYEQAIQHRREEYVNRVLERLHMNEEVVDASRKVLEKLPEEQRDQLKEEIQAVNRLQEKLSAITAVWRKAPVGQGQQEMGTPRESAAKAFDKSPPAKRRTMVGPVPMSAAAQGMPSSPIKDMMQKLPHCVTETDAELQRPHETVRVGDLRVVAVIIRENEGVLQQARELVGTPSSKEENRRELALQIAALEDRQQQLLALRKSLQAELPAPFKDVPQQKVQTAAAARFGTMATLKESEKKDAHDEEVRRAVAIQTALQEEVHGPAQQKLLKEQLEAQQRIQREQMEAAAANRRMSMLIGTAGTVGVFAVQDAAHVAQVIGAASTPVQGALWGAGALLALHPVTQAAIVGVTAFNVLPQWTLGQRVIGVAAGVGVGVVFGAALPGVVAGMAVGSYGPAMMERTASAIATVATSAFRELCQQHIERKRRREEEEPALPASEAPQPRPPEQPGDDKNRAFW